MILLEEILIEKKKWPVLDKRSIMQFTAVFSTVLALRISHHLTAILKMLFKHQALTSDRCNSNNQAHSTTVTSPLLENQITTTTTDHVANIARSETKVDHQEDNESHIYIFASRYQRRITTQY